MKKRLLILIALGALITFSNVQATPVSTQTYSFNDDEWEGDEGEEYLIAKLCSEGGCPIEMIERLREEKRAERAKNALRTNAKEQIKEAQLA